MTKLPSPVRALRAAVFAAVCVALAAVGHSSMSDGEIPFGVLLGASAGVAGLAWVGARRRRGGFAIGASLLAVQGSLHVLFARTEVPSPSAHVHHHMDMDMGVGGAADSMAGMAGMAGTAGMGAHSGIGMVAAHALAGLLCAAWLARGEAALYRLLRVVALLAAAPVRRALALVRAHAPEPPARRPRPQHRPRRLRGAVHAHALVRRGPPVFRAPSTTAPGRPACA